MNDFKMYCLCLHNMHLSIVKKLNYIPVGLGNDHFSHEWIRDNTLDNISNKNKFYAEHTFHYWIWKNMLSKIEDGTWIGFCSYRDYWGNDNKYENRDFRSSKNLKDLVLLEIPKEWENYDTILGKHIFLNKQLKFSKVAKHGVVSLLRNPRAIFKSGRTIRFHFDMFHGNGNLDKAIDLLDEKDREDFRIFTRKNVSFNRGNMFICKSKKIIRQYYESIFPWLFRCEQIFGFNLRGYGEKRMYGFLAERHMSYWFSK